MPLPVEGPSVGRTVHYVSHGTPVREDGTQTFPSVCRTAIVTEVDPEDAGRVGLVVLNPSGQFFHPLAAGGSSYAEAAGMVGGSWHWPERV
ncbi:hypothetical protein SSBG_02199 [Streptomyces sp. SPB074]|nr:hypothetical protein SSBG_02199 [Streptomyces sp. SPB074]